MFILANLHLGQRPQMGRCPVGQEGVFHQWVRPSIRPPARFVGPHAATDRLRTASEGLGFDSAALTLPFRLCRLANMHL